MTVKIPVLRGLHRIKIQVLLANRIGLRKYILFLLTGVSAQCVQQSFCSEVVQCKVAIITSFLNH